MFHGGNYGGFGKRLRQLSQRDCYYIKGRRKVSSHSRATNGGKPVINLKDCKINRVNAALIRKNAPRKTRMLAEAETGYVSKDERMRRAFLWAAMFGIFGGGIALLLTGTPPKSGHWTTDGLLIAGMLAVAGAVIGYFSRK